MSSTYLKIRKLIPASLREKLPKEIGIVEIGTGESRRLNKIYREKDKPTNVLSFFYGKEYGEILVCPFVVKKEAKIQKNEYQYQMTWMILHGMLHLAGLHHEKSQALAERVLRIESKILKRIKK